VHNYLKDNKLDGYKEKGIWKINRSSVEEYQNYISTEEVSKIINKSQETIRRYIKKGELDGKKIGGMWRIRKESVEEYKEKL
jgi:excisionase family DNA binding protein